MIRHRLDVLDSRTGRRYQLRIANGAISAAEVRRIRAASKDPGLLIFDPSLTNTAWCQSSITMLDAENGVLRHRGYAIEQLVATCTYVEVAYLLIEGELPNREQLTKWQEEIAAHTVLDDATARLIGSFSHDAWPVSILVASVAAMSTGAKGSDTHRGPAEFLGKLPVIVAAIYSHIRRRPFAPFDNHRGYAGSLLTSLMDTNRLVSQKASEDLLETLLIVHADHEQNCSTVAVRSVASTRVDPCLSIAAGIAALSGPLHGSASGSVVAMLDAIGSKSRVREYVRRVKRGDVPLAGFGHHVYKNYDPRAVLLKREACNLLERLGGNTQVETALELDRVVAEDDDLQCDGIYPTIELYSGPLYSTIAMPPSMFPLLFAISRVTGWLANQQEMSEDAEQRIVRPRQIYDGPRPRSVIPIDARSSQK